MRGFKVGRHQVGEYAPCLVIAEVGLAHDGSMGMAHAYIDAAARSGAGAVKFQCHIAEAESSLDEQWRVSPEWPQDSSRYDYWMRTSFSEDQWQELSGHALTTGMEFLCSPFSVEAVKLLNPLVPAWKIPSGEILNEPMMRAITASEKPVLLSTGMAKDDEIQGALDKWGWRDAAVLQCTSMYPCPPERLGLGMLEVFRAAYDRPVGLSDHSGTIWAGLAAVAMGCDLLEVHVCFSREQFGFDVEASLTFQELAGLVKGIRFIEAARGPVFKDHLAEHELGAVRELFMEKWKRKEISK